MGNVLVIWDTNPESIKIFALRMESEELAKYMNIHGKFINSVDTTEAEETVLNEMSDKLEQLEPMYDSSAEVVNPLMISEPVMIIHCGFLL